MNNALNELHLIKDGVLDREQVNYIIKNPEEPKNKFLITTLLTDYQKEKRKMLSLNELEKHLKISPEAAVELNDLPEELRLKILALSSDNIEAAKEQKPHPSSATSALMQIKKEWSEEHDESDADDDEDQESSSHTSIPEEAHEPAKTAEKKSKGKARSRKSETVSSGQPWESLAEKKKQLEQEGQKIDKDLLSIESEKTKAEKKFQKAEKKLSDGIEKLKQAVLMVKSLSDVKDQAFEHFLGVLQRIEDLKLMKKNIAEERCTVDKQLILAIQSGSSVDQLSTTFESIPDQTESVEILQTAEAIIRDKSWKDNYVTMSINTSDTPKNIPFSFQEVAGTSTKTLDSLLKRVSESTSGCNATVNKSSKNNASSESEEQKKSRLSDQKANSALSEKSSCSFQEPFETMSKRVSDSASDCSSNTKRSSKNKAINQPEEQDKQRASENKTEKGPEDTRKRFRSESSERRPNKITRFDDERPSSSASSSQSVKSEPRTSIDSKLVKGFNPFRDDSTFGCITKLKVHKDYVYIASSNGHLRKFSISNLKNSLMFELHGGAIQTFTLHKITDALYTGCDDGKLRHFDSKTAERKDSFLLCSAITCMEEGKTVLYIGLQNGTIYRYGFMSNKLINTYAISSSAVLAIKLLAEYSEESRIVVCCANAISVRNSSNGAMLRVFPNSENLGFLNLSSSGLIYFLSFDPSKRGAILNKRCEKNQIESTNDGLFIDPRVTAFELHNNYFYFGTYAGRVVCLKLIGDYYELQWVAILSDSRNYITDLTMYGDTLLASSSNGSVSKVTMDANGPYRCRERFCNNRPFARKEDLDRHMNFDHWTDARRGTLYQCHRDNCRSVMSSSEVRRPYHQQYTQNRYDYYHNYPQRGSRGGHPNYRTTRSYINY